MPQHNCAVSPKREYASRNYGPYADRLTNNSQLQYPEHKVSTPRPPDVYPTETPNFARFARFDATRDGEFGVAEI